jgi:acetolactate synthase I/II/III large subunit
LNQPVLELPVRNQVHDATQMPAAAALLDTLEHHGVDCVFGVPGSALTALYQALYGRRTIRHVLAKHEAGAAFMAGGFARAGRRLGVCWTTTGPGATNALTPIACARADSLPVLLITGNTALSSLGRGALQESTGLGVDVVRLFEPVTKLSLLVPSAERLESLLELAIRTAQTGRPGPVHLSVPSDVLGTLVLPSNARSSVPFVSERPVDRAAVAAAIDLLSHARRPCILSGHGVDISGAWSALSDLARGLGAPVVTTPKGKSVIPETDGSCAGVFGFGGHETAERLLYGEEIDVLLIVGTTLGEFATNGWDPRLARGRRLVQIDVEGTALGRNFPLDVSVVGDARAALEELAGAAKLSARSRWHSTPPRRTSRASFAPRTRSRGLAPAVVVAELRAALPDDGLLFVDNGNAILWGSRHFETRRTHTYFATLGLSAMGTALPAAIGAKLALPSKRVAALIGDAAFAMTATELHTAVEHGVGIVSVILNDGGHGMVHHGEKLIFGHDLGAARFTRSLDAAGLSRALGVRAFTVTNRQELRAAFEDALASDEPALVDVRVDPAIVPEQLASRARSVGARLSSRRN